MLLQFRKRGTILFSVFTVVLILACSLPLVSNSPTPSVFDATKAVLEFEATVMSMKLTQAADNLPPTPQPASPTAEPQPTASSQVITSTQIEPTPTEDLEARIQAAKVLVYENTDASGIGMWIGDALEGMNIKYTQTGSYSGRFMEYLNSGTDYDLIIVGAEDKMIISGEFWDVINTRLSRDKVALIAEIWYLDSEANGPISQILSGCGVRYQKDYDLADSIYWWEPTHPVFNEPNTVLPLLHYNRYWANQTGDQIRIGSGGNATLLAGLTASKSNQEAVLATCYDGRVIIQTFSDHDYAAADIIPLWQNYIHYTLKNHFAVKP
jgi:hypothetical protein